ncbi:MAG: hypothetical protein HXP04_05800 [Trueperella pyogenes]|nr:hypothetical protein [Trueperella pyogenes]
MLWTCLGLLDGVRSESCADSGWGLDLAWWSWVGVAAGSNVWKKEVLVDMCHGCTWSNGEYREHFGVTAEEARSDLRDLMSRGLVTSTGERRWVRYMLAGKR